MLLVQKFGGTSMGDVGRIREAAKIVLAALQQNNKVVLVVSAMAGITNQLVALCDEFANSPGRLEHTDVVLASGEIASAGLMALALSNLGIPSVSLQAWQLPIHTNGVFGHAEIIDIECSYLNKCLNSGIVPIICGFQGLYSGKITTLGRGGSDVTAVAIAAALKADRCDIYTDVAGVYTADPRKIEGAQKLAELDYELMTSMAINGAKVMHPRASEIARTQNLSVVIRSSFAPHETGTLLINKAAPDKRTRAINISHNKCLISMPYEVFDVMAATLLKIDNVIEKQSPKHITISLNQRDLGVVAGVAGFEIMASEINKVTVTMAGDARDEQVLLAKITEIAETLDMEIFAQYVTKECIGTFITGECLDFAQMLHDYVIKTKEVV
jgi:aspartate kinase